MIDACCPKCGRIHHVGEEHAGFLMKCEGCGQVIPITSGDRHDLWTPAQQAKRTEPTRVTPLKTNTGNNNDKRRFMHLSNWAWLLIACGGVCIVLVLYSVYGDRQQGVVSTASKQVNKTSEAEPWAEAARQTPTPEPNSPAKDQDSAAPRTFIVPVQEEAMNPQALDQAGLEGSDPTKPRPVQPKLHRDMGVDLAIPIYTHIALMERPDASAERKRTVPASAVLVLLDREPTDDWFDVIDVRSGKEGWVNKEDVQIDLTKHPAPPAKFSEEYTGSDAPPDIIVENQSSGELSLKMGGSLYSIQPNSQLSLSPPGGAYSYYAMEPGVMPAMGEQAFKRGYSYTWRFWVETRVVRIP
jgi:ribosomal protein S27E